jgi:hypothetical protein
VKCFSRVCSILCHSELLQLSYFKGDGLWQFLNGVLRYEGGYITYNRPISNGPYGRSYDNRGVIEFEGSWRNGVEQLGTGYHTDGKTPRRVNTFTGNQFFTREGVSVTSNEYVEYAEQQISIKSECSYNFTKNLYTTLTQYSCRGCMSDLCKHCAENCHAVGDSGCCLPDILFCKRNCTICQCGCC